MTVAISTPETQLTQLTRLSDAELIARLHTLVARDRAITAALLVHLAEVDERRLYAPAGYSSMHAYCVGELKFSDDEAYKRIRVARAARAVPALLAAFAESRVTLTAAKVISPHITRKNAEDLIAAAASRSKFELEQWIAQNFGDPRYADSVASALSRRDSSSSNARSSVVIPRPAPSHQLAPGPVEFGGENADFGAAPVDSSEPAAAPSEDRPTRVDGAPFEMTSLAAAGETDTERAAPPDPPPSIATSIPLKLALSPATYEKLLYARGLLAHSVPSGDLAQVFDRALDALIARLEKQKFAATDRPRARRAHASAKPASPAGGAEPADQAIHDASPPTARSKRGRPRIPAEIRRAVRSRDGGRCTFTSGEGRRCGSRHGLEFDHVTPVALGGGGGDVTLGAIRLRCRAHNQYEAERALGRAFMNERRANRRAARAFARGRGANGAMSVEGRDGAADATGPAPG